jgi:putative copper export protein
MHVISVVVWIGGLIFLNAVMGPVVDFERAGASSMVSAVQKRYQGFAWMSLWTMLTTGFLLMLLSPRFLWFEFSTAWSRLLLIKQVLFGALAFFAWQIKQVLKKMDGAAGDEFDGWRLAYAKLLKRSVAAGILAMLCAGGMMVV